MTTEEWTAIAGVAATVLVGIGSWVVSASLTRRGLKKYKLSYRMTVEPLLAKALADSDLRIFYGEEPLPKPALLSVDIINNGDGAVSNPPIRVTAPGATYCIPRFIESPPPGYEDIWSLEREDGETCRIVAEHINPHQVLRARFLLDSYDGGMPVLSCPMADLQLVQVSEIDSRATAVRTFMQILREASSKVPLWP